MQGNKPMVGKIIERALKSLSDNQVIINRDVWLKVRLCCLCCVSETSHADSKQRNSESSVPPEGCWLLRLSLKPA